MLLVEVHEQLAIAARPEHVTARLERRALRLEPVDLAVDHRADRAVDIADRLRTTFEIDHREPGMTERQLAAIEAEARERWKLDASLIIHRYGRLEPGEQIVLVVTAASHRQAALESCAFLIDWLKTKAPFWKLEQGAEGEHWVEARASDDEAAARWRPKPPKAAE